MELGNTHLMESLKAARKEAERMKKMLIKQTNNVSGSPRKSSVRNPTRSSGATVGGTSGIQDVYLQSLKQALSTSAQTIEGLKKQVAEFAGDKENCLRKVCLAEDATSKVNDELAKVAQLLSESHAALIANKKAMEHVESEKVHWKDLFVELQFRTGSNAQEVEVAKKLADATQDHIAALEKQVKRLEDAERQKQAIETTFTVWLDQEPGQRDLQALKKMADSFTNSSSGSPSHLKDDPQDSMLLFQTPVERERQELETKLRYEFEKRYSDVLNLRVSHERKRVLTRIEMLCATQEQPFEAEATARQQQKPRVGKPSKVSYRLVHKIVSDAYDHLGFSEWSATDLDVLHAQIESLQAQLAQQHMKLQRIERFVEAQGMALAKANLLQQEKEFLLAELIDKYRELRAAKDEDALGHQTRDNSAEPATELVHFDEKPLTVYGHPQRLEFKKVRARPVSASPCLISTEHADREESGRQQSPFAAKQRSFSTAGPVSHARMKYRLGNARQPQSSPMTMPPSSHRHIAKPFLYAQPENNPDSIPWLSEPQQQVKHIRSILKTELVQISPAENQLEDDSHLGPDRVRFIYLVPCLRHCDAGLLMANLEIVVAFVVVDPANPLTPSQSQMRNLRIPTLFANKIAKEIA
ncbi:hypothetical protein FI667_g11766, partial [Globisporangium splendens]